MFQGHLRQDTAQPHQVPRWKPKTMKRTRESKKRWDSTMSPKKATRRDMFRAWVWLKRLPTAQPFQGPSPLERFTSLTQTIWVTRKGCSWRASMQSPGSAPGRPNTQNLPAFSCWCNFYLLGSEIFKISPKFGTRKSLNTKKIPPRSLDVTEILEGRSFFCSLLASENPYENMRKVRNCRLAWGLQMQPATSLDFPSSFVRDIYNRS